MMIIAIIYFQLPKKNLSILSRHVDSTHPQPAHIHTCNLVLSILVKCKKIQQMVCRKKRKKERNRKRGNRQPLYRSTNTSTLLLLLLLIIIIITVLVY
ncbi:unnamed protein product [Periconia digitata]|uniref:Uncharacterized protein n=1 Tax=Periconia digitata TaxID=1303443 RepID=A0A9W4XWM0_9PLEO|nr:unnamed protein product [Periconia digitata]